MNYMFDHTTIVAEDDPQLAMFKKLSEENLIQLRKLDGVGCEKFATLKHDYILVKWWYPAGVPHVLQ